MDREQFIELLHELHAEEHRLNSSKGVEYCQGAVQVTDNFRRHARELGMAPSKVWATYFLKHLDAVMFYVKTGRTESEALRERVQDMRLYLALLLAMSMEDDFEHPTS